MTTFNRDKNVGVWFDIPVADLDRAASFYRHVLSNNVSIESFENFRFAVLEHQDGNGGCLVERPDEVTSNQGILLYLNVHGRIREAVAKVTDNGGEIINDVHPIGPHGFRAIIRDSEGNRLALHSESDE